MPTPDPSEYYAELLNSQLTFDAPDTAGRRLPLRGGDDPPGQLKQSGSESTEATRPKPLSINQLLKSSPISNDKGTKQAPSPAHSSIGSWADEVEMSEEKRAQKEARRALKQAKKEQAKRDRITEAEERRKNGEAPPQPCVNCSGNHWSQDCTEQPPEQAAEPAKGKSKKKRKKAAAAAAAAAEAASNTPPETGESAPGSGDAADGEDIDEDPPEDASNEDDLPEEPTETTGGPQSNLDGTRSSPSPLTHHQIGRRDIIGASAEDNAGREGARRLSAHASRLNFEQTTGRPYQGRPTTYPELGDLAIGPNTPSQGTREQNAAFTKDTVTSRDDDVTFTGSITYADHAKRQLNRFDAGNGSTTSASPASSARSARSSSKRRLTTSAPTPESKKKTVKPRGPAPAGTPTTSRPTPTAKAPALPSATVHTTKRRQGANPQAAQWIEEEPVPGATRYSEGRHLYLRMHEDLAEGKPNEAFHPQILKAVVEARLISKAADWESCQRHDKKGGWVAAATSPAIANQCAGKTFQVNGRNVQILPFQSTNPRAFLTWNTSTYPDVTVAKRLGAVKQIPNWVKWWVGRDTFKGSKGSCCIVVFDGPTNILDFELPLGYHETTNSAFTARFRAVKTGDKCEICGELHQGKGTLGCPNLGRMELQPGQDMPPRTLYEMPEL